MFIPHSRVETVRHLVLTYINFFPNFIGVGLHFMQLLRNARVIFVNLSQKMLRIRIRQMTLDALQKSYGRKQQKESKILSNELYENVEKSL